MTMAQAKHPWQAGPAELCEYALGLLEKRTDVDNRISFLLFDVLIELIFKTYLLLPESISKVKIAFSERKKYASGTFHDLIDGLKKCTALVCFRDLAHVEFYHDIRNRIYHQGNGITINRKDLENYGNLVISILKKLLRVNIPISNTKQPSSIEKAVNIDKLTSLRDDLQNDIVVLKKLTNLLIEKTEPILLFPSTLSAFSEISHNIEISSFPMKIIEFRKVISKVVSNDEMKKWLLSLITDDLNWDSPQELDNTRFLMELLSDPYEFYLFVLGFQHFPVDEVTFDTVCRNEDISFIHQDEYHILGIYSSAKFFVQWTEPKRSVEDWMIPRGQDLIPKMNNLVNQLKTKLAEFDGKRL